jgi:hypothetical protein
MVLWFVRQHEGGHSVIENGSIGNNQEESQGNTARKDAQQICPHLQFCSVALLVLRNLCLSSDEEARLPFGKGAFECSAGVC